MVPAPDGFPAFIRNWLSTPLTFTTIFIIWTVSLVFRNVIDILRAWIEANPEQRILSSLRQHVYDHIQSLSLDFFMGDKPGR
jgi:ABC-type bacteriocin/lantibiotic exporter with double-glycine peptidase domain